jgi:alpha-L-arabinofuranosidase
VILVTSSGTDPGFKPFTDQGFAYLNTELRKMNADIIDEHFYRSPEWFLQNASRYDSYPRNSSKVFVGEYAAHNDKPASSQNKNTLQTALAEAAFMTGMERNADVVVMASYAPLFAHTEGWQWTPDMIWVDNLKSVGTPNYYVQKLYSLNKGTNVVPLLQNNQPVSGQDNLYASATVDKATNELILKLVNTSGETKARSIHVEGVRKLAQNATVTVMKGEGLNEVNSLNNPQNVVPKESAMKVSGKKLSLSLAPYSFTILRVKMS